MTIPFDYRVFLFTACVSVLGVLFFGTMPACRYTQLDLSSQLKANSATIARRSLGITAGSIQIGFSTILLITAILMIKTFSNLERLNPGFDRAHILDVTVDPKSAGYSQTEAGVFFREFKERVAAMPGVRSVAYAGLGVMRGSGSKGTFAPQGITLSQTAFLNVSLNSVTPSYFETMGIGLLSGRSFVVEDLKRKPRPVIVNRTFANVFFPRENAVGKLLVNGFDGKKPADAVIVGICETAKYRSMRDLSVKNRLDEVKFRCFPVKRTLRRQECSPRRSGGERTVYLSCSTKRFPPSCCFASRRQRSNETDAGRPVQRKLLAAGPANHTGGSRNRHGGDWLPGRPQGEGFRNPESGFCDRCGDVLRV